MSLSSHNYSRSTMKILKSHLIHFIAKSALFVFLLLSVKTGHTQVLDSDFVCGRTITDAEGNAYRTVLIEDQCWMAENLRTGKYQDGSLILKVTDDLKWIESTSGAWANFENDAANDAIYGKLYNWYAVGNDKKICPIGWRVPSFGDWDTLADLLGSEEGYKMKSITGWVDENAVSTRINGSNSSGFTGLSGGFRGGNGSFLNKGKMGFFWSSTLTGDDALSHYLTSNTHTLHVHYYEKTTGFSVRCLMD